jgi:transposase-like protein
MEAAMRYSKRIKSSVLKKVLPPESRSVPEVAREMGISEQTIYGWKKIAEGGTIPADAETSPSAIGRIEKLSLLLEGKSKSEEALGSWLREKGLHSEHLNLWEQELRAMAKGTDSDYREENAHLRKENRRLEKELQRKEKALAEMAAILTLKKKAAEIWGEREDA